MDSSRPLLEESCREILQLFLLAFPPCLSFDALLRSLLLLFALVCVCVGASSLSSAAQFCSPRSSGRPGQWPGGTDIRHRHWNALILSLSLPLRDVTTCALVPRDCIQQHPPDSGHVLQNVCSSAQNRTQMLRPNQGSRQCTLIN